MPFVVVVAVRLRVRRVRLPPPQQFWSDVRSRDEVDDAPQPPASSLNATTLSLLFLTLFLALKGACCVRTPGPTDPHGPPRRLGLLGKGRLLRVPRVAEAEDEGTHGLREGRGPVHGQRGENDATLRSIALVEDRGELLEVPPELMRWYRRDTGTEFETRHTSSVILIVIIYDHYHDHHPSSSPSLSSF